MQHQAFDDGGVLSVLEAWQMTVEPWWLSGSGGQRASTLAWTSADGEIQDTSMVAVSTDEQARVWAEIDLPLMLPNGAF